MKNVAICKKFSNEEVLKEFHLLLQKIKRSKRLKTFLFHISQLVDFVESNPIFINLRFKWSREKEEGLNRLHSLKLQVYNKSKMAYELLKSRLRDQKLIDVSEIQSHIRELETLFGSNERNCSPSPWCLVFDGVKALGIALEKMERTDLLKDLAELRIGLVSIQKPNSSEYATKEKVIIDHFTFAEGVTELVKLQNRFYFKIESLWAIWERLIAVHWCFRTPFSYWKNKRLRYTSRFYLKESWQRLNLHAMWGEINKIKKHPKDGKEFLFQRNLFEKYLKVLSSEVTSYLEEYQAVERFHFFLQGECLWIVLKTSSEPDAYEFFMIKELREYKNLYNFTKTLSTLTSPSSIKVPEGYTTASLLSHLNMPTKSQLALLFFNGWSAEQIHFKGKTVKRQSIENQLYIPDLLQELAALHDRHQTRFFSPPIDSFLKESSIKA